MGVGLEVFDVLGVSLRPILGQPWLSLGSEFRFGAGGTGRYNFRLARAVIDVEPYEGIRAQAAYSQLVDELPVTSRVRIANAHQIWFGLSFTLAGIEARAAALGLPDPRTMRCGT